MSSPETSIRIPVDLTNPGQFFACCGLLELADRLWPGAEGWFEGREFCIAGEMLVELETIFRAVTSLSVLNTMTLHEFTRLEVLSEMKKAELQRTPGLEDEKKSLESLRRELPIIIEGAFHFCIDWFRDDLAGGSRFKTWAGQQSVLDISQAMHAGLINLQGLQKSSLWDSARNIGLPFNFDSDLGAQGSARDIGFSFDPLASSELTRIAGSCKPVLEFLCFVGLQRFRPREIKGANRFVYTAWSHPLSPAVAAAVGCQAIAVSKSLSYEFSLLYRTKYLKSFLPAQPFQGDPDE